MHIPRVFHNQKLTLNDAVSMTGRNYHHLIHVLRKKVGDIVNVFNGIGGEYQAEIYFIGKKELKLNIIKYTHVHSESKFLLNFAPAIARNEKMDLIIQKAVELGVTTITPILTERCKLKMTHDIFVKKKIRWQEIIISASEQCGRCMLPHLNDPMNFLDFITIAHEGLKLFCDPETNFSLKNISPKPNKATLLTGPESGLTATESKTAKEKNFLAISLGPRILRTETAALAALTLLQFQWGDL